MKGHAVLVALVGAAVVVLALALVWILVLDKADTGPRLSSGCGTEPPVAPGTSVMLPMTVDGVEREYLLHLPSDYTQDSAASLVLAFHSYGYSAQNQESATWLSRHADKHGYIAVYPQATSFQDPIEGTVTSWNDLSCNASPGPEGPTCASTMRIAFPPECGQPTECNWCTCNDDLAYVDRLLDELEDTLCIDLDRVYATGEGNGAMFVHRLGCDMADRFAAIAPVAGTPAKGFRCLPSASAPISIMHLHGDQDGSYPADGSESTVGWFYVPVADIIDAWAGAESQDCEDATAAYPTSMDGTMDLECAQRPNCATGAEVVSCTWAGDHHSYVGMTIQFGNDVIWEFFNKNSKQR